MRRVRPVRLCSHALARFSAPPTLLGAPLHQLIAPGQPVTILCAGPANLPAHSAGPLVTVGAPEHEVGTRPADLRAVLQQPDVLGRGMLLTRGGTGWSAVVAYR
jgi:hypothetical protein